MLGTLTAVAPHAGDAEGITQAAMRARVAAPSPRGPMRAVDEERGRAVRDPALNPFIIAGSLSSTHGMRMCILCRFG